VPAKKNHSKLAGRLVLGRIPGTTLDSVTKECLADGTVGGVVLFKENAQSLEQVAELCKQILEVSHHSPVIAVDQEGGAVQRFEHLLTPLPSQMALASSQKEEFIEQCARINARQCKELGINCLLTPVMDVLSNNLNPIISTRSFGSDEIRVSQLAKIVLKAIADEGVCPVGKHFPGHGSTLEDSHLALAVNVKDETAIWKYDLMPFRECLSELPALLVGHIWLQAIDEEPLPASLSHRIINRILRGFFEYDGLVMTDDLTMKAVTEKWGLKEAAVRALEATTDLVLVLSEPAQTLEVSQYIAEAIKSGRLLPNNIEQSIRRLNRRFGTRLEPANKEKLKLLKEDVATQTELTLTASTASVALLTGGVPTTDLEESVVEPARGTWKNPISSGEWMVVAPNHPRYTLSLTSFLRDLAQDDEETGKAKPTFREIRYPLDPSEHDCQDVAKRCAGKNCIFLTFRSITNKGQVVLGGKLKEKAREVVAVACENPMDITVVTGFKHFLATFDPSDLAMRGLACVLLGILEPLGSCPINLELEPLEHR
jgi:beta-N-acetylhexosaminidase